MTLSIFLMEYGCTRAEVGVYQYFRDIIFRLNFGGEHDLILARSMYSSLDCFDQIVRSLLCVSKIMLSYARRDRQCGRITIL